MLENTAFTGLDAAMSDLSTIGNNIANTNTVGYKKSTVRFSDIYATGLASGAAIGIGVRVSGIDQDFSEGSTELTGRNLDMSIQDSGFFVLRNPNSELTSYTRAGQFTQDKEGNITSHAGNRLQGYRAINNIITADLTDLQVPTAPLLATPTSSVTIDQNLDSASTIPAVAFNNNNPESYNHRVDAVIYDSLGNSGDLTTYYIKTAANSWDVQVEVDGTNLGSGTLSFNSSGSLTGTTGLSGISWSPTSGATAPQVFDIGMTGSTQLAGASQTRTIDQDGFTSGVLTNFDIDNDGILTSHYSNGRSQIVGKVAIAKFTAPQSLGSIGNMSWVETGNSGAPVLGSANSDGIIRAGSVELSNVDMTSELVKLLSAQRDFQANAQVISTSDDLNQTIINI